MSKQTKGERDLERLLKIPGVGEMSFGKHTDPKKLASLLKKCRRVR